ncbi:MAG: BMP family ABC transporter substrate-binding protein [Azospirillaceae bacterium]|nr:BMP family ABC transporter substrate-binding protein [Azospirillaceae bacterium]
MTFVPSFSRRAVLAGLSAGVAAAALPLARGRAAGGLTVGFIYVGARDDYGYNQAHAAGAAAVKALGIKVVEEERVPETIDVEKTMESMINLDGAALLFPTSFGYFDPHILKLAKKYQDVTFLHCGGLWHDGLPANTHSYFGYIDEAEYLAGIVAAHVTKTRKFGFVAAKPIPQVLRNINAFTLGARSIDPTITTQVIFTGDWSMPVKEAEATNSLADQGVDVVTCHVDSPKVVIETAEKRGLFTTGYHANQAVLAPKGYLTGAEWNWESLYPTLIGMFQAGKPIPGLVRGGLKAGFVKLSPYGAVVPDAARAAAEAIKAKFMGDGFAIFAGEIKDNKGAVVIPAGTVRGQTDIELEKMSYLVEGVIGAAA